MKIRPVKLKKKNNLTKIYLSKNQGLQKSNFYTNEEIELSLKNAMKTIYSFHYSSKKIWFIGFSAANTATNSHLFLPKTVWTKGLIGNRKFVNVGAEKKKHILFGSKKPELLVIYNLDKKTLSILKEFYKLDTPIIILGSEFNTVPKFSYINFVPISDYLGNLNSFCSFLISSILKKSTIK